MRCIYIYIYIYMHLMNKKKLGKKVRRRDLNPGHLVYEIWDEAPLRMIARLPACRTCTVLYMRCTIWYRLSCLSFAMKRSALNLKRSANP